MVSFLGQYQFYIAHFFCFFFFLILWPGASLCRQLHKAGLPNRYEKHKLYLCTCYEMKCITGVSSKLNPQIIVGNYGTSSICSARTIRETLTRF